MWDWVTTNCETLWQSCRAAVWMSLFRSIQDGSTVFAWGTEAAIRQCAAHLIRSKILRRAVHRSLQKTHAVTMLIESCLADNMVQLADSLWNNITECRNTCNATILLGTHSEVSMSLYKVGLNI